MPEILRLRRQRPLPWDVLLVVFENADRSTLAALAGVSLDFLTTVSPQLYKTVEITSVKGLKTLFSDRQEGRLPSRIDPHLSLDQIHTLIIDFSLTKRVPIKASLSLARSVAERSLPLDTVLLSIPAHNRSFVLLDSVLNLLNPRRCCYDLFSDRSDETWPLVFLGSYTPLALWNRMEVLEFCGAAGYGGGAWRKFGVQPQKIVRIHLSTMLSEYIKAPAFLQYVIREDRHYFARGGRCKTGSVELVVQSREHWLEVEDALEMIDQEFRSIFKLTAE